MGWEFSRDPVGVGGIEGKESESDLSGVWFPSGVVAFWLGISIVRRGRIDA